MKLLKKNPVRLTYRRMLTMVGLLVFVAVGVSVARAVSAPSHGHITTSVSKIKLSSQSLATPATPASDIQTAYFHLSLPTGYKQQPGNQSVPGLLYQQMIIKASVSGSLIIAIGLSPLGAGLNDNTAYSLRSQDLSRYKLTTQAVQGEPVVIANDTRTAAVVAFWPHHDKLAIISVSSGLQDPAGDNNADEVKALQPLLMAWQWQ